MAEVKTLEEHRQYVEGFARLSFFFARKWLKAKFPEQPFGELLSRHTPLLYHGLNYPPAVWPEDPECQDILRRAERLKELPPEEFENAMWDEIKELAAKRAELNYPNAVGVKAPASWNCGSLKYDVPGEAARESGRVVFHIANAVGPRSIFEDPEYLPHCFLLLMTETEFRFGSRELSTSTWLNERQAFLNCFPPEWLDNMGPRPSEPPVPPWSFGTWGQLVTRRGTINPQAEKFVRENGYLKYICRPSHCSFESMRKHLKAKFGIGTGK